uniref:Uncharacterized protein n=1 Tax=Brassica oleracea TaxID=3712 RepID=A0A3P6CD82_BRAOL|nr:unnamed protein product [Brassica oleracea]
MAEVRRHIFDNKPKRSRSAAFIGGHIDFSIIQSNKKVFGFSSDP